jgi:hypothetical protein
MVNKAPLKLAGLFSALLSRNQRNSPGCDLDAQGIAAHPLSIIGLQEFGRHTVVVFGDAAAN